MRRAALPTSAAAGPSVALPVLPQECAGRACCGQARIRPLPFPAGPAPPVPAAAGQQSSVGAAAAPAAAAQASYGYGSGQPATRRTRTRARETALDVPPAPNRAPSARVAACSAAAHLLHLLAETVDVPATCRRGLSCPGAARLLPRRSQAEPRDCHAEFQEKRSWRRFEPIQVSESGPESEQRLQLESVRV